MKKWGFLIKFIVSALLLFLVFKLVDLHNLIEKLQKVNLGIILLLVCGYGLAQILSAFKWWIITKTSLPNKPFSDALSSYYMGMFINIFGLGMIGGDLSRAVFFAQERSKVIKAVGTVVADRIHGLLILVFIGFIALATFKYDTSIQNVQLILIGIAFLFIVGWFFATNISNTVLKFFPKLQEQFQRLFTSFPRDIKTLVLISIISALFHIIQILLHGLMSYGLGETIPITALFCFIPLVNIFSSLPISWMGLGIREVSYVFFLTPAFVSKETAIAFGAIWFFANITSSIIGGLLVYWIKGFQIKDVSNILAKSENLNQI